MGVYLEEGAYGFGHGLVYSFPVTCSNGSWTIVKDLHIQDTSLPFLKETERELQQEKQTAFAFLGL